MPEESRSHKFLGIPTDSDRPGSPLAALFEQRAQAARDAVKPTTVNMRVALLREQAKTWEKAADILRANITPATRGRLADPRKPGDDKGW